MQSAQSQRVEPSRPPSIDTPELLAASISRAIGSFMAGRHNAPKCHGPLGDGRGEQSAELYDDWNKPKKGATPEQPSELASRFRLPIQKLRPRKLHARRVFAAAIGRSINTGDPVGIKGTPMPPAGASLGSPRCADGG